MTITLGLEEELQVIGPTGMLVSHDVEAGKIAYPDQFGTSSCEIHYCALEVQTPVCPNADMLVSRLAHLRMLAALRARAQGQAVMAAGTHPSDSWRTQPMREAPDEYLHYAKLLAEYGDVARGAMTFGLHLHFGVENYALRMPVMNRLREVLPEVLALSASAPYFEGRDTGMQSWRHSQLDRYPRMGMPQVWQSEEDYFAHLERLRALNIVSPEQGMWEDVRIHHRFGTIEVRICDATPSLDRVWLIAALLLCEVHTLVMELTQGTAKAPLERHCLDENRWRARRHGMKATWIDWHSMELVDTPTRFRRWLKRITPAARELGLIKRLPGALEHALEEGTSADAQRQAYAAGGQDFAAVVAHLVAETAKPLHAALSQGEQA